MPKTVLAKGQRSHVHVARRRRPHASAPARLAGIVLLGLMAAPSITAQVDLGPYAPPSFVFNDFHPRCDARPDAGFILHEYLYEEHVRNWDTLTGIPTYRSVIRGIAGHNGSSEWTYQNHYWHKFPGPLTFGDFYWAPIRGATFWGLLNPMPYYSHGPAPLDPVQPTPDTDGDGVCDVLAYGWDYRAGSGTGALVHLSGADGATLWSHPIEWRRTNTQTLFTISDFPTGLHAAVTPEGPRFAWKTTDAVYDYDSQTWVITEKVRFGNLRDGSEVWSRNDLRTVGDYAVSTYVTGIAELDGEPEAEVLLDDQEYVPPAQASCSSPRRITATALRGTDGTTLWGPTDYFTPSQAGNVPNTEETRLCFRGAWPHVLGDINDNGRPDLVATYLTLVGTGDVLFEDGQDTTVNGRYTTHVAPINGTTGQLLWPGRDLQKQGWGFPADLNTADSTHPLIAIGLVDLPSPAPDGARFPNKDARLSVLRASDGSSLWGDYRERFALESYLMYDLALQQYTSTLAPHDWDHDGVRDLVTPARYAPPTGSTQLLLAGSGHEYQILSGRTGDVLSTVEAFGPRGRVIACAGEDDSHLTVLSGHARRVDLTRINVTDGGQDWRVPTYVNRRPLAQMAGLDAVFQTIRCADVGPARTIFGGSAGFHSYYQEDEIIGIHGAIDSGALDWILPPIRGMPPNAATLDPFAPRPETPPTLLEQATTLGGSAAFGLATGLGLLGLQARLRRGAKP